jgi:ubiquinone/menaquinone biosynthesis C-methylase UbiE
MMEDPRAFLAGVFDRASETYDAVGVDYFGIIAQYLIDDADPQPGERVLDVGCGRGAVLFRAAEAVGAGGHVTGIDLAPGMVTATARDIAEQGLRNAEVRHADAQEPQLDDATYDVVLASLSLFFLPRPPDALAGYRRVLRPGGRIAFTTFAGNDPRWAWLEETRKRFVGEHDVRPPGVHYFGSDEAIAALVEGAGFVDVTSRTYHFDVRFENAEQWWTWTWSQTMRGAWERLSDETMGLVRAHVNDNLERIAEPDGSVHYDQPVRTTVAFAT